LSREQRAERRAAPKPVLSPVEGPARVPRATKGPLVAPGDRPTYSSGEGSSSAASALLVCELLALAFDVAQPRVDHRRFDEVHRTAATGQALAGAQAVDGAGEVADRDARLGLGAQRAQALAQPAPHLAQQRPSFGVAGVPADPGLQLFGAVLERRLVAAAGQRDAA